MGTEIRTWKIIDDQLVEIETTSLESEIGEREHVEGWIQTSPKILGEIY